LVKTLMLCLVERVDLRRKVCEKLDCLDGGMNKRKKNL